MNEEIEDVQDAVSEPEDIQTQEQDQPRMVPLAALEAERRKRQESEARNKLYQEYLSKQKEEAGEKEDPHALVEKSTLKEESALTKREIREEVFKDMNPEAVTKINKYLNQILERKPWLADSIDSAPNRYARANEIVNDYLHLVETPTKSKTADAQKIVQNFQKPGSPVAAGKSAQPSGVEYLKSIQGTKEFREYRQRIRQG